MTHNPIYNQDRESYISRMEQQKLLSRAEIGAAACVPDDVVVFWIRQDLLKSEENGERKHKRFSRREVRFAVLLRELRKYGMNVGALREIISQLRSALEIYDGLPSHRRFYDALTHAQDQIGPQPDDPEDIKRDWSWDRAGVLQKYGHLTASEAEEMRTLANAIPLDRADILCRAYDVEHGDGWLMIWQDRNGHMVLGGGEPSWPLPAPSMLILDLGSLLEGLAEHRELPARKKAVGG